MLFFFVLRLLIRNFVAAMLELNEVCLKTDNAIDRHTLSMMAEDGQLTCLTGGDACQRGRLLLAILGLAPLACGYISIDGEPVNENTSPVMRRMMGYVPDGLKDVGQVVVYAAPTVDDVFHLKANRRHSFSQQQLEDEVSRISSGNDSDGRLKLLAASVLLDRPVLLIDNPPVQAAAYLQEQASRGRVVVVSTTEDAVLRVADKIVEL